MSKSTDFDVASIARDLKAFAASDFGPAGDRAFDTATALEQQNAALDRVRSLHAPVAVEYEEYSVCAECSTQTWPCATVLALDAP